MATALGEKIKSLIEATGPIDIAAYFAMCLGDPEHGYYLRREPFGRAGDFVTAPEVSQLFGEMIGIFMVQAWQACGSPPAVRLVELGPGRGTMMADMLRVIAHLAPQLYAGCSVHLVETSERLVERQVRTLSDHGAKIAWNARHEDVPPGFTLLVANEFFDAIPIRQFVRTGTGFRERLVGIGEDGELAFLIGAATLDGPLPPGSDTCPEGTVFEIAPAREAIMQAVAERLHDDGGVALVIDYGHLVSGLGDTLQALKDHAFDPPLAHPGEADLTSHVDFESLARAAASAGAHVVGATCQGDFLVGLGLLERAGALGAGKDNSTQESIRDAVERLAAPGPGKMGELFKAMAVAGQRVTLAPFRPAD